MNDETNTSKLKAPYASVKSFSEILNKSRQYQLRRIDSDTLSKWGYKDYDVSSTVSALKFLNIIDDNGNTSTDYASIRSDIKYEQELRRIVETGYARLFSLYDGDLAAKSRKDIEESIILDEAYPGTAKQSAGKAAALFIWLCQQAGITLKLMDVTNGSTVVAAGSLSRHKVLAKKAEKKGPNLTRKNSISTENNFGNIWINIDSSMTEEDIYQLLGRIHRAQQRMRNEHEES